MSASFLILSALMMLPAAPVSTRGDLQTVVPRLPNGHHSGVVAVRVRTVELPIQSTHMLVDDLFAKTGVAVTSAHGVRIEVVVPRDVHLTSFQAHVADGLVLQPAQRSFVSKVGHAMLSIVRLMLFGRLVSAADDLAIPGAAWAMALGAPSGEGEMVRLTTGNMLVVERGQAAFTDHGDFVVCRAVLALSPWTELIHVRLIGFDTVSEQEIEYQIPRLPLNGSSVDRREEPAPPVTAQLSVASTLEGRLLHSRQVDFPDAPHRGRSYTPARSSGSG